MHKKIYIVIIAILFLIIGMATQLFWGSSGLTRQEQVKEQIAEYQAQVDSLQAIIEQRKIEIDRLHKDSLYKENLLRTHYGMSRDGEKVFQLVK